MYSYQERSVRYAIKARAAFLSFLLAFRTQPAAFNQYCPRMRTVARSCSPSVFCIGVLSKQRHMGNLVPVMNRKEELTEAQVVSHVAPSFSLHSEPEHDRIRNSCLTWVTDFVVKHHLCPWAKGALSHLEFHIIDTPPINEGSSDGDIEDLYAELISLAEALIEAQVHSDSEGKVTTMLIALPQYHDFNGFLSVSQDLVDLFERHGISDFVQVATFHPDYCFRDETSTVSAYTNRSPYPMLHYLLVSEVSKAIDNYAKDGRDSNDIWQDNINKMHNLADELGGEKGMQRVFEKMCRDNT